MVNVLSIEAILKCSTSQDAHNGLDTWNGGLLLGNDKYHVSAY